jgi:hypothetical protein
MTSIHITIGVAVLLSSLAGAIWGGYCWRREKPSQEFWYVLRVQQSAVAVQAMIGAVLLMTGAEASNDLHYLYGGLPLLVTLLAEGARAGAANQELAHVDFDALPADQQRVVALAIVRRETGIMTVSCIVIFFLALRAAGTSPLF